MVKDVVQVPRALLLSSDLAPSAKLVWTIARLRSPQGQADTRWLAAASGLSRPTVLAAMKSLRASNWDLAAAQEKSPAVPIPSSLLQDRRLGVAARLLYGQLLLTPGFSHPLGHFTRPELASLAQVSLTTLAKALDQLVRAEWVKLDQAHRLAPTYFELSFPGLERSLTLLDDVQRRLERAPYFGETLMREFLTLLIDSDEFEDDAAPGFLVNPRTGERLQLNRFYPPKVAFEFQGPQHYRATARFSAKESAEQQERDYIKLGICVTRGITLVSILPEALSLQGMQLAIGDLLPRRDLSGLDLVIEYLESQSRGYRRSVARF